MQGRNAKNARIEPKSILAPQCVASSVSAWLTQRSTKALHYIVNRPLFSLVWVKPTCTVIVYCIREVLANDVFFHKLYLIT